MATQITDLPGWDETNDALALAMESALELLGTEPPSDDPASNFQQARAQVVRINEQSGRLAAAALQRIDDAIAASGLVAEITGLSNEAKEEAQRLKNAAKTVAGIAKAVDKVAGVVTKIAGLPFL